MQQKKNFRSYKRILNYLFLQKLKCTKFKRILGGKATTKKNGNVYYYYYCNDCIINIKENTIEETFDEFMFSIVEYDSIVNQYFLVMIKQKVEEIIDKLEVGLEETEIFEQAKFIPNDLFNYSDIISKWIEWLNEAIYTANNETFDVRRTRLRNIRNFSTGIIPVDYGINENNIMTLIHLREYYQLHCILITKNYLMKK